MGILEHLLHDVGRVLGQTHGLHVALHLQQEIVMLEVGVMFEQTLYDLVALFVVDQHREVAHECLDDVVDYMDGEVLQTHVQHATTLHVLCQSDSVLSNHLHERDEVALDLGGRGGLAVGGLAQFQQFGLLSLF